MGDETPTAKAIARKWWRDRIDEGDDFNVAAEAKKAADEMRNNEAFCRAFLDEMMEPVLHEIGQRVIAIKKAELRTSAGLRRQITKDLTEEVKSRWQKWMQFDPDQGLHVPLVNMNRAQLLSAADYMEEKAAEHATEARFLRVIASKLSGDAHVADTLSDDDLDTIRASMKSNVTKLRKAA